MSRECSSRKPEHWFTSDPPPLPFLSRKPERPLPRIVLSSRAVIHQQERGVDRREARFAQALPARELLEIADNNKSDQIPQEQDSGQTQILWRFVLEGVGRLRVNAWLQGNGGHSKLLHRGQIAWRWLSTVQPGIPSTDKRASSPRELQQHIRDCNVDCYHTYRCTYLWRSCRDIRGRSRTRGGYLLRQLTWLSPKS